MQRYRSRDETAGGSPKRKRALDGGSGDVDWAAARLGPIPSASMSARLQRSVERVGGP